jgi:hypothetical protein
MVSMAPHALSSVFFSRAISGSLNFVLRNCSIALPTLPVSRMSYSSSCAAAYSAHVTVPRPHVRVVAGGWGTLPHLHQ